MGNEIALETYRILRSAEELENYVPDRFPCVVKATHSSGQAAICIDSSVSLDRDRLRQWFSIDHYLRTREQNYRHLVPKIIVEEFFSEDGRTVPDDYKIFCFRGVPKPVQVDSGSFHGAHPKTSTMRRGAEYPRPMSIPTGSETIRNPPCWARCSMPRESCPRPSTS